MTSKTPNHRTRYSYKQADQVNFAKTNLFFIKSKHAFKNYKNHEYFQSKSDKALTHIQNKQFVSYPTAYGINNAYKYLCDQMGNKNVKKIKFNSHSLQKNHPQNLKTIFRQRLFSSKRKKHHDTLPNFSQKSIRFETISYKLQNQKPIIPLNKQIEQKSQMIDVIFLHKDRKSFNQSKYNHYNLKVNIYQNIINTFLKSRISYKEMTRQQFSMIKDKIVQIFSQEKESIEYKDIVNIKYVREVFKIIEQRDEPVFTKEILRYFFVSSNQIYEYQLQKIIDQLKKLVNYQFQQDISSQDIYIYSLDGKPIKSLHDMIACDQQSFVCGIDKNIYQIYKKQKNFNNNKRSIINRINKWKNAIPLAPQQKTSFRLQTSINNQQKYNKLFQSVRKKRFNPMNKTRRSMLSLRCSQFINKEKLCRDQNIFQ